MNNKKVNEFQWGIGDTFICQQGNEILHVTLEQDYSDGILDDFKAGSFDEYITCIQMIESRYNREYGRIFKDGSQKFCEWNILQHLAGIKESISEEAKELADREYEEGLDESGLKRLTDELFTPDKDTAIIPLDNYMTGWYRDEYRVTDSFNDAKAFLVIRRKQMEKFTGRLSDEKWIEQVNEATSYYLKNINDMRNNRVVRFSVEKLMLYDDESFYAEWERSDDGEWWNEAVIESDLDNAVNYMGFGDMDLLETDEVTEEIFMSQEAREHFHNEYYAE